MGTDVLPYQKILSYDTSHDDAHTWVYVPFESLDWSIHGDHVYYATIRVENAAGLSSFLTSNPYRHVVQLPASGVVLDVERYQEDHAYGYFGVCFNHQKDHLNLKRQITVENFIVRDDYIHII